MVFELLLVKNTENQIFYANFWYVKSSFLYSRAPLMLLQRLLLKIRFIDKKPPWESMAVLLIYEFQNWERYIVDPIPQLDKVQ